MELRLNWLGPEGVSEKELKKRTLTNLCSPRTTYLVNAHDQMDRAMFLSCKGPARNLAEASTLVAPATGSKQREGSPRRTPFPLAFWPNY